MGAMMLLKGIKLIGCRKYQFMEVNTQRRAAGLKDKIPDIQKTLDTVRFLRTRKVCSSYGSRLLLSSDIECSPTQTPSKRPSS